MDKRFRSELIRHPGDSCRSGHMDRAEGLPPRRLKDADEIHDGVRAFRGTADRSLVPDIRLNRNDLSHASERLQEIRQIGPPDGHANAAAGTGELLDSIAPDETRPAEYGDDCRTAEIDGHLSFCPVG